MIYKVVKERMTDVENPITLKKGEVVRFIEASNPDGDWAGWLLCATEDNEGYIPVQIVDIKDGVYTIKEDYCAREFDVCVGDIITGFKELNGWIWGYKNDDKNTLGWAPINHMVETKS